MTISMYQASVPRFVNILGNLSNILDKAQTHVDAKKLDIATLTTYRLFPDMLPMTTQVQIACDTAKGVVARLAMVRARTAYADLRPHTQLVQPERWYAQSLNACGRPADAEPIARQCLADQRLLDGENSIRVVDAKRVLAAALTGMGRWPEAVQLAEQVRADQEPLLPGDHIDAATGARALATALWPTRRVDLIAPLLVEEEAVLARLKADTPTKTMARHRSRAYLAAWAGNLPTVLALADIVMADSTPAFANERARVTCARSLVLRRSGQYGEALRFAEQALVLAQAKAPNLMPVDVAQAQAALGLARLELGDADAAMTHLVLAESEFERGQMAPCVWYADARLGQARVHLLRGDQRSAQPLLNQVEAWWAQANPGSIWHAEAQAWQTQACALPA